MLTLRGRLLPPTTPSSEGVCYPRQPLKGVLQGGMLLLRAKDLHRSDNAPGGYATRDTLRQNADSPDALAPASIVRTGVARSLRAIETCGDQTIRWRSEGVCYPRGSRGARCDGAKLSNQAR
jgi:hypothetical protein